MPPWQIGRTQTMPVPCQRAIGCKQHAQRSRCGRTSGSWSPAPLSVHAILARQGLPSPSSGAGMRTTATWTTRTIRGDLSSFGRRHRAMGLTMQVRTTPMWMLPVRHGSSGGEIGVEIDAIRTRILSHSDAICAATHAVTLCVCLILFLNSFTWPLYLWAQLTHSLSASPSASTHLFSLCLTLYLNSLILSLPHPLPPLTHSLSASPSSSTHSFSLLAQLTLSFCVAQISDSWTLDEEGQAGSHRPFCPMQL